jgi:hypothetical protein
MKCVENKENLIRSFSSGIAGKYREESPCIRRISSAKLGRTRRIGMNGYLLPPMRIIPLKIQPHGIRLLNWCLYKPLPAV